MGIQIRKFQAPTLQDAIQQVRDEMGDNAIILQTEPLKNASKFGIFSKNAIEVTAAIDRKELPSRFHASVQDDSASKKAIGEKSTAEKNDRGGVFRGFLRRKKATSPTLKTTAKSTNPTTEKKSPATQVAEWAKASASTSVSSSTLTNIPTNLPTTEQSTLNQLYAMKTFMEPLQKELDAIKTKLQTGDSKASSALSKASTTRRIKDPLEEEVQKLRAELKDFITDKKYEGSKIPPYLNQLMSFWIDHGMSTRQVHHFFSQIESWGESFQPRAPLAETAKWVSEVLQGTINEADPTQRSSKRIVILVGPTGVGKSTTIAKMAAFEKLQRHRSVSLVTVDDYKIGATDQMNHYSRILEIPFVKGRSDISLEDQCKLLNSDTIFVDTFGISMKDETKLEALKKLLQFKDPQMSRALEIHLALPVNIPSTDVQTCLKQFETLHPNFLIFTKWDETDSWGGMLAAVLMAHKPVSYVCHGQNVPDDMSLFSKQSFIETITGFYNH